MNESESLTNSPVLVLFERSPAGSSVQEVSCSSSLVFQPPVVRNLWSWCWCITPEILNIQLLEEDGLMRITTLCWTFTSFSTRRRTDYWRVQRMIRQPVDCSKSSRNTVNTPSDLINPLNLQLTVVIRTHRFELVWLYCMYLLIGSLGPYHLLVRLRLP